MKSKPIDWLYELEYKLHPDRLMKYIHETDDLYGLLEGVDKHIRSFRPCFLEWSGTSQLLAITALLQIVATSNTVHGLLIRSAPKWSKNGKEIGLRQVYLSVLHRLETLLEDCIRLNGGLYSLTPFTAHSLPAIKMRLKEKFVKLSDRLDTRNLDIELSKLLVEGLQMLINRKRMTRSDIVYIERIFEAFAQLKDLATANVEEILYENDFNIPVFVCYWIQHFNRAMSNASGLHRQLEILISLEERLNLMRPKRAQSCLQDHEPIHAQLTEFLTEKKRYIRERIALQRKEIQDTKLAETEERMPVNLSVAQFGLFIRLFIDDGTLPQADIGATFTYFARHFRTPKAAFISADSLQKKSSDVESVTVSKVKGQLIGMVNRLNTYRNFPNQRGL